MFQNIQPRNEKEDRICYETARSSATNMNIFNNQVIVICRYHDTFLTLHTRPDSKSLSYTK